MASKKITVFGGSGFLGRYLVKRLCAAGWQVRVAVRNHERAQFLKPMGDVGQITILQTNVLNERHVFSAIDGVDAVVNLVGVLYQAGGQNFENVHHIASRTIAQTAKTLGVKRLVHVSALGVDVNSDSLYSQSKAKGENDIAKNFSGAKIVRPSVIFGPEDNFFNMFASFSRFLPVLPVYGCGEFIYRNNNRKKGLEIRPFGNGGTKFQPVYVGDVADAIFTCLCIENKKKEVFELGGPKIYTFRELMNMVLDITKRKRVLVPIPYKVAFAQAFFLQMLPKPLLTCDQVRLLQKDNIVSKGSKGFNELDIVPVMPEIILPKYLSRFST